MSCLDGIRYGMVTVIIIEIAGNLHAPFGWLSKSWWRSSRDSCWGQKWWHSCLMNSMVDDKHRGVWWSYTWDCYGNHTCSWLKFEICTTIPDFHILWPDHDRLDYVSIKKLELWSRSQPLIEEIQIDRGPTMIEAQSMIEKPCIDRDTNVIQEPRLANTNNVCMLSTKVSIRAV